MRKPFVRLCVLALVIVGAPPLPAASEEDEPVLPIAKTAPGRLERFAEMVFSDGKKLRGMLFLRGTGKIKIFDKEQSLFREFPLEFVRRMDTIVLKEVEEKHWRWLEHANDEKVYTGKTYWWRQYDVKLTFVNGKSVTGSIRGPVYMRVDGEVRRFILHDRDKGKLDEPLEKLVYVKSIDFAAAPAPASQSASEGAAAASRAPRGEPEEELGSPE